MKSKGLRPIYLGPGELSYMAEISTPLLLNAMIRNKIKESWYQNCLSLVFSLIMSSRIIIDRGRNWYYCLWDLMFMCNWQQ